MAAFTRDYSLEEDSDKEKVKEALLPKREYYVPRARTTVATLFAQAEARFAQFNLQTENEFCEITEAARLELLEEE